MTKLTVNGQAHDIDAPPDMPLLWVLRDLLQLTGTKFGCGIAQCGACTVHVDGAPLRSCLLPISALEGRAVTTVEAIGVWHERAATPLRWTVQAPHWAMPQPYFVPVSSSSSRSTQSSGVSGDACTL